MRVPRNQLIIECQQNEQVDGSDCGRVVVAPPTFIAEFSVESCLAVADLSGGGGGPDVDAPAVAAAVLVFHAVVLVLAPVAVEARLAATPG